jgi:gluconolactonase
MQLIPEISIDQFETYAEGLDHSECLAFDSQGVLWAGGEAGQVYRIDRQGQFREVTNIGGFCLGLAFSPTDDLYVCNPKLGAIIKDDRVCSLTLQVSTSWPSQTMVSLRPTVRFMSRIRASGMAGMAM